MAESKPFEATPTWIARAKREGNIARSQELSAICGFLLGAVALAALIPSLLPAFKMSTSMGMMVTRCASASGVVPKGRAAAARIGVRIGRCRRHRRRTRKRSRAVLLAENTATIVERVFEAHRMVAHEMGIVMAGVNIRDDVTREPSSYEIRFRGELVGSGALRPERF